MNSSLADRVARLEARVAILEEQAMLTPPPLPSRRAVAEEPRQEREVAADVAAAAAAVEPIAIPEEVAVPAPTVEPADEPAAIAAPRPHRHAERARAPKPPRPPFDFERFFGLAVLGRVGIGALVLAAAWFTQLGWGHLSPALRVVAIYAGGLALCGVGFWLRPRVLPRYVAMLWGGGTALCYLAGVAARLRYEVLGPLPALLLLVLSAGLGQWLARTLRLEAMALLALAGAFAAPVLVGSSSAVPTGFYVYLLALHTWAAVTERRWGWRWSRLLAVVATAVLAAAWLAVHPMLTPLSLVLHSSAVLLGLGAPELLQLHWRRDVDRARWLALMAGAWAVQLALLQFCLWQDGLHGYALAAGAGWLALGAWLLYRAPELRHRVADVSRLGGVLLVLGAVAVWNGSSLPDAFGFDQAWSRLLSLVAAGALLLAVRRWTAASDFAVAIAAGVGIVAVATFAEATAVTRLQAALVLALPAALLLRGQPGRAPTAGLLLGLSLLLVGVHCPWTLAGDAAWWLPVAAGFGVLWTALGLLVAQGRRDDRLQATAARVLVLSRGVACLLALGFVQFVDAGWHHDDSGLVAALWVAGPLALGAGALLQRRLPALSAGAADAARFGGLLCVAGSLLAFGTGTVADTGFDQPWLRLGALVAVGGALLALRRWTAGGEFAAAAAALAGTVAIAMIADPTAASRAQAGMLLLLPAALLLTGRGRVAPTAGFALGGLLVFVAVRSARTMTVGVGLWLPVAFALTAVWAGSALWVAERRRDVDLLGATTATLEASRAFAVLLGIAMLQFVGAGWHLDDAEAATAMLLTGLAALGGAAMLLRHQPTARERAADLARLGGLLLVFGLLAAGDGTATPTAQWLAVTGGVGAMLATRRWTALDQLPALAATLLATTFVLQATEITTELRWLVPLLLTLPAAIVLLGRWRWLRGTGLVLGGAIAFFGLTRQYDFTGPAAQWLSVAFGAAGGWAALGALAAGRRSDRALLLTATAMLAVLGVAWSVVALQPAAADTEGLPAFFNLRFLTAIALLALLDLGRRRLPAAASRVDRTVFVVITLALGYIAGLVETLALVRGLDPGWSRVIVSLFTLLYAGGLLVAGFLRQQRWLRLPGLLGFAFVVAKVGLHDLSGLSTPLRVLVTGALGLVLLAGAWLYARVRAQEAP